MTTDLPRSERWPLWLLALIVMVISNVCQGQFQQGVSTTSVEAAEAIKSSKTAEPGPSNLRLGPVNLSFTAGLREEYCDNVGASSNAPKDDLVSSPHVGTHIYWPISQLNKLDVILNLAYQKYLNNSQLDTQNLLVQPGSAMNFDFFVKDIHFNLHDRLSIQQDPTTTTQLSNVGVFRRTGNTLGILAEWDLNKILLDGGIDYDTFKTSDAQFKSLDSSTYIFHGRIGYRAVSPLVFGLEGSYTSSEYDQQVQNNSATSTGGLFGSMIFSEYLRGELQVDYQRSKYETSGTIGDNSQFDSIVFSGLLSNQLNRWCSHSAQIRRHTTPGIGSNYTETYDLNYDATLDIFKDIATSMGGFVEVYQDSGSSSGTQTGSQTGGQPGDKGYRYGFRLQLSYQLFESTRVGAGYQRTEKISDIDTNSYEQNRVFFDLSHRF